MTPERWKQIEELYHAAGALPAREREALLAEACRDDEELRHEVESLLNEPISDDGFLAEPAILTSVRFASDLDGPELTGQSLGVYQLRTLLGAGGMGDVYLASDTKLERDVAIKILPHAFMSHPDRLARFEREARMLAALNHPNICSIYGLEESNGIRFLVLELVDGQTLAEALGDPAGRQTREAGLPARDALTIGRQIAIALEAAHERGIIHRDLKPANIKITPAGVVKVLDFGLAKTVGDSSPGDVTGTTPTNRDGSNDGAVMGTADYMSPEQARGEPVDKRTDIWAFGCVLFEMLSGRAAFAGDTMTDTIAMIVEREPDWTALPANTPEPLRRLLFRCLTKDPKHRLRDIGDVRIEIDGIDQVLPGLSPERVPTPRVNARLGWLPWIAVAALAAGIVVWAARRPAVVPDPLANARFTRFTDWEGQEGSAEISPDGKFVAFLADREGRFDLWLGQIETSRFVNLTADIQGIQAPGVVLRNLGFSGDGAEIWFGLPQGRVLIPLLGGTPRTFMTGGSIVPAWSPDAARLVYVVNDAGDPLFVADRTGADARKIFEGKPGLHSHNPVWSPDGEWIYFVHGLIQSDEMDVWRIRPSGGEPERLTHHNAAVNFLAPLDSRTVLYTARERDRSGPWLWAVDVTTKVTRRVSWGVEQYTSIASSQDGRRVVATVANPGSSLWRVPLLDRPAEDRDVQPFPVPTVRALAPRFGGTALFYLSAQGTADALWRLLDGETRQVWKGSSGALVEPPAVSPDGRRIALILRRNGAQQLTIMSADGTSSQTMAPSIDIQGAAGWSPDAAWIVAGGKDAQGPALFKIPIDGGTPIRLVAGQAVAPAWAPDGTLIVYEGANVGGRAPLLAIRPDGTPVQLPPLQVRPGGHHFLPGGKGLVYLPDSNFWLFDLESGATRQLTRFGKPVSTMARRSFDISPDGTHIVFDRPLENSDIIVIDLPK